MRRKMGIITLDPSLSLQTPKIAQHHNGVVIEEIDGLIKVYGDGHVERFQIVPHVTSTLAPELGVTSRDIVIDKYTNIWARFYVPKCQLLKLPLLVYFHGGGFCVGSAAWSCYHNFLAQLSAKAGCIIMSVNYRLAPENRLPAAYDDGLKSLMWLKQQAISGCSDGFLRECNFSTIFLGGDSAGANIAQNVSLRLDSSGLRPLGLKGNILIQPFFGGEERTHSEKYMAQPARSALTLEASDTYWRLALPVGSSRDHPWCNPVAKGLSKSDELRVLDSMVCVSELDILKDRNLEFCGALARIGKRVEYVEYKGVGHAFQVLNKSQISQIRCNDMISHIRAFISNR